jgi:Domain of unknown function (DUF3597)
LGQNEGIHTRVSQGEQDELCCPGDLMGDSARMNMWLHKIVLQQIADNGGNTSQELLD